MRLSPQTRMFLARLGIVSFGALVAALGWYGWNHGVYWVTSFNARLGRLGTGPTLLFVFVGVGIILFGLFSPMKEAISPKEQEPFSRYEWKKHRYWKRPRKR